MMAMSTERVFTLRSRIWRSSRIAAWHRLHGNRPSPDAATQHGVPYDTRPIPGCAHCRRVRQRGISMALQLVPTGKDVPNEINVIIEIPKDAEPVKYEVDKATGAIFVDRVLSTP